MSTFLEKVEAVTKADKTVSKPAKAVKPSKFNKGLTAPFSPKKPTKAKKARKFDKTKSGPAHGETINPKQSTMFHLRKILPKIEEFLQQADPFDMTNPSWGKFFGKAAPEIVVALLWDLGHLSEPKDRAYMLRFFKQRIKGA